MNTMIRYINQTILSQTKDLKYTVSEVAPDTEASLFSSTSLVVWSGQSDNTIYQDSSVNYAFRALHDDLHLKTRLGFSVDHEIELGRIQANMFSSNLLQDLVYCEVALQAEHFRQTGQFIQNQLEFTINYLTKRGYK
jgi:hypothetical protein